MTSVAVIVALVTLMAAAALAVDLGFAWTARTQLQGATDAAALAAAATMVDFDSPGGPIVQRSVAEDAAVEVAGKNRAVANSSIKIDPVVDITFGFWDIDNRKLVTPADDPSIDLTNPAHVTGVRVVARMDGAQDWNNVSPGVFARLLGRDGFAVRAEATAHRGFVGGVPEATIPLPVAIPCCLVTGIDCGGDYCTSINPPVSPCNLDTPQDPDTGPVSCLLFHNTNVQNACWTELDGESPSVDANDMRDIVNNGNSEELSAGDGIYVDNGTKVPVLEAIEDRFRRDGKDHYPPFHTPPEPDHWVVPLPVVRCDPGQNPEDNCAGGDPHIIDGFVCFEIREVSTPPGPKEIRGRFLSFCDPDDLQMIEEECGISDEPPGATDYTPSPHPVLVR